MHNVTALVLRRMRTPLLLVIVAHGVSILGLVLIPGQDDLGRPWRMDFLHAAYLVSYTITTTGFGEIPYAFTPALRLWMTISIYLLVITWFYALGNIVALVQDPSFQLALRESRFARSVRRLREPFYLVCGYGDTGGLLVRSLVERGLRAVVIDIDPDRINALRIEGLSIYVPGLAADASVPRHLLEAGLSHPHCAGVVALTDRDSVNLHVAITSKLLNPNLPVICRAETKDAAANMVSFGTDHVVNPFDAFGDMLAMALHSPEMHMVHDWLTGVPRSHMEAVVVYPPRGTWVLCGFGRFGKAVRRYLSFEGIKTVVIEADPLKTGCEDCVLGRGTEVVTLREAHVEKAAGIVAGTDDDANNLSILMTARELNPNLFFVARQNRRANDAIFEAAHADLVMQRGQIIAREILALITTPLLSSFLRLARHQRREWAEQMVERIAALVGTKVPDIWTVRLTPEASPALWNALREGLAVSLADLSRSPRAREETLPCVALLLARQGEEILLPAADTVLAPGDGILFCGAWGTASRMSWVLRNDNAAAYVITGVDRPTGFFWRGFTRSPSA